MALDLPFFERYKAIFADKLNRIVSELRASTLQPGIGYKVNRTPGGTTLVIEQQGGVGGTAAADYCPFKVSDASTTEQVRVQIQADQVDDRWPFEMTDEEPFYKNIPSQYLQSPGWVALYLRVDVDEVGTILPYDTSIEFEFKADFQKEGSSIQWFYVAGINIDINLETNKPYISRIDNSCPVVYTWQPSPCPFEVEDATTAAGVPNLLVRVGKIENQYPSGMVPGEHFILAIPEDVGDWCAVYSKLTRSNNSSEIVISSGYESSTSALQYDLLAEVNLSIDAQSQKSISFIKNICTQPVLSTVSQCEFSLTDGTEYDETGAPVVLKIIVNAGKVDNVWPLETPNGIPYEYNPDPDQAWTAVYVRLHVNEYGSLYTNDPSAVRIIFKDSYQADFGTSYQWHLIGTFVVSKNASNQAYVSLVENYCPAVFANTLSNCPFEVSYGSLLEDQKVQVRNGKIEGEYPQGMYDGGFFTLQIPNSAGWYAVYSMMQIKDGVININANPNRKITLETDYKYTTETQQWDLLGEFTVSESGTGYAVDWLISYCRKPALLPTSDFKCYFKVINWTGPGDDVVKVRVGQAMIANRWPKNMGVGTPDFVLEIQQDSYIYAELMFDSTYMVLLPGVDAIQITASTEAKTNTTSTQYVLLAVVEIEGLNVKAINNMCSEVIPNPCLLDFSSTPPDTGGGGTGEPTP